MNNLSWLLYFADVVQQIRPVFLLLGIFAVIVCGLIFLTAALSDENSYDSDNEKERKQIYRKWAFNKSWKIFVPIALLGFFLSALIPSKNTIYLIAGSEAGEAVVASEDGREIISEIKTIIKQQIKSVKEGS